jgi:hypothetical protein
LGHFSDDPELLIRALCYLQAHRTGFLMEEIHISVD